MKRIIVLMLFIAGLSSAEWVDFGIEGLEHARLEVLEATPSCMEIEITVPGIELTKQIEQGEEYVVMTIPAATPNAPEPGYPMIPKAGFLAAVPGTGEVSWTVLEQETVTLGQFKPWPFQPIPSDDTYGNPPFTVVDEAYVTGLHPSSDVIYTYDGVLRGVHVGRFAVPLARYDASSGEVTAVRRIRLRFDLPGAVSVDRRLYSPFFKSVYSQVLVNAGVLGEPVSTFSSRRSGPVVARTPAEARDIDEAHLLILAGDDFVDTMMDEFVDYKHNQGFLPALVAAGSWGEDSIKSYIQEAYDTWTIPPSYVLFVGDSGELPPYSSSTGISTDNRYCCVDGSDYMADIYHGRFASPTDYINNIIDKTLKWDFDPLLDADFWGNVLCAGMLQDSNGDGEADRWFCFTCESVRDTYIDYYGKTVTREYVTDSSHPEPYYYRPDPPSTGGQVPTDITWDGNADGINDAINNGVFLVQHRDHGSVSGWADPPYYIDDLSGLSNGDKTPMVMSINCSTGQFTSNCFTENFHRMEGGAVMVVGASSTSYSYFNDYFCYGMYASFNDQYVSPPAIYTDPYGSFLAGEALMGGKLEMQEAAPNNPYGNWEWYAEIEWDLFHVFGDPTMDMRSDVPFELTVDAPATLPSGSTEATFEVYDSTDGPVEGALVCLRKADDDIYATGETDASGSVTLTFSATTSTTEMPWMVTSHNALPSEGSINGPAVGEHAGAVVARRGNPRPNPFSSAVAFPLGLDRSGHVELTIYDLAGRAVVTVTDEELNAGAHELVWDGTVNDRLAPQGVYFARLEVNGEPSVHKLVLFR